MSTRFVVAAVAAVVVGYFAGPTAGFATFSAVYGVTGFLDPNTKVQGPRLQDLKFPSASYGSPIPYVEGHPRVPGIIVWSIDPKREVASTTTQEGKGGPGVDQTTYTYEVDMRIVLCENTGYRPRRCWSNGALIWSAADDADLETLMASAVTTSWRELRVYTGDDDQQPDPTEESYVGVGLSPAYRGRSSIVIVGLNCGQSGQLPVLTWEITNGADQSVAALTRLQSYLPADEIGVTDRTDISEYELGDGIVTGSLVLTGGGIGSFLNTEGRVQWTTPVLGGDGTSSVTIEGYAALFEALNYAAMPFFEYSWNLTLYDSSIVRLMFVESDGKIALGGPGGTIIIHDPIVGRFKWKMVLGPTLDRIWINDALVYSVPGAPPFAGTVGRVTIGAASGLNYAAWVVSEFAVRFTDNYLIEAEPDHIAPPDGGYSKYALAEPTHAEALTRQWERAGLDADLLDVSAPALSTLIVRALAISQLSPPRTTMDNLAASGLYEFVETGDGVKVVMRGGSPVKTIAYEDLGAFNGDTPPDPLPRTRGNELEVTSQVSIKFANVHDDYRDGTETSSRLATGSSIITVAEVPMGLTPTEAKRLADVAVTDALSSIMRIGPVVLTRKHADIEPTDVVIFTGKDGSTYRARITKRTEGAGIITLEGVADDATVIDSAAVTSAGYTSTSSVRAYSPTDATYIDGPLLRESDNARGMYVAAKPTGTKWAGYTLLKSPDNTEFTAVGSGVNAAVKGQCSVVPGDWPTRTFNERDSIVCDLGAGTVSGTTREAILTDKSVNSFLIGAHGRWLFGQFRDAELVGEGVYKLTGLLLGDRGTEHNIGTQVVNDEIVMLSAGGINRIGLEASDMGVQRYYKAVSNGRSVAGTGSEAFTENEVALMPFAPVYLRGDRDGSGDVDLRWTRRTRAATITAGPSAPIMPLLEESESYSIEIFDDDTFTTVVRTLTSTTPSVTYTSAQQVADFGSNQAVIYARVFQISALVGRGFPLEAAA